MSVNVTWQESTVDRERRWQALGQQGATVWFTGLPSAGKTTIAGAVEARLIASGRSAYKLDGDNLRLGMCSDLGFSRDDREANVDRVGQMARLFADAGTVALVALVSPYAGCRAKVRALHERDGLAFLEVYVNTPIEECARRDAKGLYARAREGGLHGLTGVDAPYEAPRAAELELTPDMDPDAASVAVLDALAERLRDGSL
ncbi:MAG TPA: adenylyl-sulfate kinase [Solirubrobacteraceae bacterium]|nr:adenylyl-sulfate kinase [Solirubrobacteraceae bacterium]